MQRKIYLLFAALLSIHFSCKEKKEVIQYPSLNLADHHIIPKPNSISPDFSSFALNEFTSIEFSPTVIDQNNLKRQLIKQIGQQSQLSLKTELSAEDRYNTIFFEKLTSDPVLSNADGYRLHISEDSLLIQSFSEAGLYHGIQTILQLAPTHSVDTLASFPIWLIPSGVIEDQPIFTHRSMMLDVARHFFTVDEVKRLIDILAHYKYNKLHLHLSDDQGWRIEIKSWPKLTEVGSKSEVGGGEGGFYSQEDFKEIVRYASEHYIDIIPEIDMPGHTNAAALSYPILNGNGKSLSHYTGMRVGFSTFDTRKDTVYSFINDVVRELSQLYPSTYFHIGGDESHVTKTRDYIYFVNRVQKIVQQNGKQLVGWNEIAQADLTASSVVQLWNDPKYALQGASKGCKVILSPAKKAYLDMKYDKHSTYGLTWAGFIPLSTAYNWDPQTFVQGLDSSQILGLEAPLWSETIENSQEMDYLAFPRAIAYAELAWTQAPLRNWNDFTIRLANQQDYFTRKNINYYRSPEVNWTATGK